MHTKCWEASFTLAPICYNVASGEKEAGHRNHALQELEQGARGSLQRREDGTKKPIE